MKTFNFLKEDLRKWFSKTDPAGDWKRINSKGEVVGPCAREPGEPKPKCMSRAKRESLTKKERAAAVRAKRKHDPDPERKGSPINVSNFGKGKISENMENLNEKNVPTNPELWSRAKALARSKFDVYPSAYANGWASKWYKGKGGSWKSVSEAVKDEYDEGEYDQEGDMAKSDLRSIMANAKRLHDMIDDADNLPEWCQNKITLAEDYISTVANYLTAEMNESDVYGKPTTEKTPTVTLKHKTSGKEIVVTKKSADGYKKIGYHPIKEEKEFVKTGKEATHNKTGEKTYEYAKLDKEGRKTGERHYRNAQGKHMGEEVSKDDHSAQSVYDKAHTAYMDKHHKNVPADKQRDAEAEAHKHASSVMKKQYPHHTASKGEGQVYRLSKEEVEQIDEISDTTVGDYVKKRTVGYLKTMKDQSSVHPSDVYNKMSDKHKAGIGRAMKRLVKPVKEETVEEQLYKQGRFVTGAGKKPFKAPTLASPRVEESRGHKMIATFMKNREVAQRAFTGQNKPVEKPKEEKKPVKESRKAEIVKNIMKKKKSDQFEAEPELSNTQSKSDQTV